jgi:hypothetical protein
MEIFRHYQHFEFEKFIHAVKNPKLQLNYPTSTEENIFKLFYYIGLEYLKKPTLNLSIEIA